MSQQHVKIELDAVQDDESRLVLDTLEHEYGRNIKGAAVKVFLEKTASSKVYQVGLGDGEKLVVKRSFWYSDSFAPDSSTALEEVYALSERLRTENVKLPRVFRKSEGGFIHATDKERIVVIEYMPGRYFRGSVQEFTEAGRALASFHKAGLRLLAGEPGLYEKLKKCIPFEKPYEESRILYHGGLREKLLNDHTCSHPEVCLAFRESVNAIDETIGMLDDSGIDGDKLTKGILHNDLHSTNILFDDTGKMTAILDIDQAGVGPLVWDVGNSLASLVYKFLNWESGGNIEERVKLFMQSYHAINPLPGLEYGLLLAATQRWDVLRILRSLRRHHYENDRLPGLLPKIKERLIPRIKAMPGLYAFMTEEWINKNIK